MHGLGYEVNANVGDSMVHGRWLLRVDERSCARLGGEVHIAVAGTTERS
jgi:hypothetical protein